MTARDVNRINELIALLDRTERLIVTFFYVERLSTSEIAMVLDLTPDAVSERLQSIRHRVRRALTGRSSRRVNAMPTGSIELQADEHHGLEAR